MEKTVKKEELHTLIYTKEEIEAILLERARKDAGLNQSMNHFDQVSVEIKFFKDKKGKSLFQGAIIAMLNPKTVPLENLDTK